MNYFSVFVCSVRDNSKMGGINRVSYFEVNEKPDEFD